METEKNPRSPDTPSLNAMRPFEDGDSITRVGVINWDCSVPSETTFFGRYATRSLGPREFRDRTPFYAVETGPDTIQYHERTLAEYETELRHAIAAGIDYFAYCWYDRAPHTDHVAGGRAATVDDTVCELTYARLMHLASPLRDKIGLCAILIASHPYSSEELADLAKTMEKPCYEKVDGHPLIYLFTAPWQNLLERLRVCCKNAGVADPYAVLMADTVSPVDAPKVQALCAYGAGGVQAETWDAFFEEEMARNDLRSRNGLPVVPHFSMGWNPTPRIRHPVPWAVYPEGVYAPPATVGQLLTAANRLKSWTMEHRDRCPTGHVLTFAWNEFEEGAWICPTLGPDRNAPDTRYRDAFAQIAAVWKRENQTSELARGAEWPGFSRGMGIGGWLTNYKRFNVLPEDKRLLITEGDLEHFDSYITEADVANIASMGVDHIRLGFDQIVLEETPGHWRERTFGRIDAFVDWCGKYGLNLVLNLHKAVGNYCDIAEKVQLLDDDALQRRFIDLWVEMERRYQDHPGIAFELLNEVRNVPAEKWNDLADRAIRTIRTMNPDRWIVIGSTCWNAPGTLKDLKVWDDPRVVYTFHMYAPFEFTHQRGVLQSGPMLYNRAMPYPTRDVERYRGYHRLLGNANAYPGVEAIDRDLLREFMRGAYDFIKAHPGKILWNGEFGTIRHANPAWRLAYMRDVIAICREWGIPYCVWNYLSTPNDGNRFSLVDDDTRKLLIPVFDTTD